MSRPDLEGTAISAIIACKIATYLKFRPDLEGTATLNAVFVPAFFACSDPTLRGRRHFQHPTCCLCNPLSRPDLEGTINGKLRVAGCGLKVD